MAALPGRDLAAGSPPHADATRCPRCKGQIEPGWAVCGWCGGQIGSEGERLVTAPAPIRAPTDRVESIELPSGTLLLGRYRIDALLGRGGFGITYRARDMRLHRDVAIKELFPPSAMRRGEQVVVADTDTATFQAARERFQREAAALARFNHPSIVRIFEVFEANATAYLVMELIQGSSVAQLLTNRGKPFDVEQVLDMVLRVGSALGAVHDAGLLHRDVNPSNLMVDGSLRIVLIDFGLARRFGDDISGSVTRAVTPGYAPPEQYAGSAKSGPPCDVFGLAATAYKLLTGVTPTNVFDRQAGTALPAPAELSREVPSLVSAAILDGMELDPGHRPATTRAFLARLGLHGATPNPRVLLVDPAAGSDSLTLHGPAPDPVEPLARAADAGVNDGTLATHPPQHAESPISPADRQAQQPHGHAPIVVPAPEPAGSVAQAPGRAPSTPFAPWHDGGPPVVGPAPTWRGWVTWPGAVALTTLASASPLAVNVVIGLVLLPLLATTGDLVVHRYRNRSGAQRRRWHDASTKVVAPVRFVRNVIVGAARSLPALAVAAIGYATERVFHDGNVQQTYIDLTIRVTGVAMALILLIPARHGGRGFRSDLGLTTWAGRAMENRTRPGTRTFVVLVTCAALTAFAVLLNPEFWPLK